MLNCYQGCGARTRIAGNKQHAAVTLVTQLSGMWKWGALGIGVNTVMGAGDYCIMTFIRMLGRNVTYVGVFFVAK